MSIMIAFIPARSGSQRVKGKNVRPFAGHPLIAYSIASARKCGLFSRIVVSTDSEETAEISRYYGAEVPFLRPAEYATTTSPDIEWIRHALKSLPERYDCFSIVRPTSPFRSKEMFLKAWNILQNVSSADSVRAVELCHEHPGKMWTIKGELMEPLLDQEGQKTPWYDGQYQALPKVYVQNSSLEIAWTRVVEQCGTRGGVHIAPLLTEKYEGFSIDYEEDWILGEMLVKQGKAVLPHIEQKPYAG